MEFTTFLKENKIIYVTDTVYVCSHQSSLLLLELGERERERETEWEGGADYFRRPEISKYHDANVLWNALSGQRTFIQNIYVSSTLKLEILIFHYIEKNFLHSYLQALERKNRASSTNLLHSSKYWIFGVILFSKCYVKIKSWHKLLLSGKSNHCHLYMKEVE